MGYLYVLHFERPIRETGSALIRNQHYTGYAASDVWARIEQHMAGTSKARFTEIAYERGIPFTVAGIWQGATPKHERIMKARKRAAQWCRLCRTQVRTLKLDGTILQPLSGVTREWVALIGRVQPKTLRFDAQSVSEPSGKISHALPDRLFVRDVRDELAELEADEELDTKVALARFERDALEIQRRQPHVLTAEQKEAWGDLPPDIRPIRTLSHPDVLDGDVEDLPF